MVEEYNLALRLMETFLRKYFPIYWEEKEEKLKLELGKLADRIQTLGLDNKLNFCKQLLDEQVSALKKNGYCIADLSLKLRERGLFGANNLFKLLFEVGLSWDYLLDLPFIPASSIKGAFSAYLESLSHQNSGSKEYGKRGKSKNVQDDLNVLFGSTSEQSASVGSIVFLDAYPVRTNEKGRIVAPMVITPHYHKGGKAVEFEYKAEPVPIIHLVVDKGVVFRFVLGINVRDEEKIRRSLKNLASKIGIEPEGSDAGSCKDTLLLLAKMFYKALASAGVGGRTTKGYGVFQLEKAQILYPEGGVT